MEWINQLKHISVELIKTLRGRRSVEELLENNQTLLNPVNNYINDNYLFYDTGHFHSHYSEWRMKRIRKILEIYGIDWEGKKILELGGYGDIGAFFAQLGAKVLSLEGRVTNVNFANLKFRNLKNFKSCVCDLEKDFTNYGRFDLIINFGLIEVIKNIDNLLECCIRMSDNIILETIVCDSTDPQKIIFVAYDTKEIDHPISSEGSFPSPFYIEKFFKNHNFSVNRYFDEDLNAKKHFYDWPHKNDNSVVRGRRRFWDFRKIKSIE